jgi:hypothetical protein
MGHSQMPSLIVAGGSLILLIALSVMKPMLHDISIDIAGTRGKITSRHWSFVSHLRKANPGNVDEVEVPCSECCTVQIFSSDSFGRIEHCVKCDAYIDVPAYGGLMREAITRGEVQSVKDLLNSVGTYLIRDDDQFDKLTSLHWAAASGSIEMVNFLLGEPVSANPNAVRGNNFTPLHAAAMEGHLAICERLLDVGADPNVQTEPQLYAPIHSAAWGGHVAVIRALVRQGARLDLRNYRNETPIETAKRNGMVEAVRELEG